MHIVIDNLNITAAERLLCETALTTAGNIVDAAKLLGLTRHALKRRIIKHGISKQGASRHAHGQDIVTSYEGDAGWSVRVFFGQQLRHTIFGQRHEGDAYWAGDDWALANRVLVPDTKETGGEYVPIVFEAGKEVVRLTPRKSAADALEHAEQLLKDLGAAPPKDPKRGKDGEASGGEAHP